VTGFLALAGFGWQLSRLDGEASLWSDVLPALACNGIFLMFVMATTAMQTYRDVRTMSQYCRTPSNSRTC